MSPHCNPRHSEIRNPVAAIKSVSGAKQRVRQQIQQNRFVIIGAGAIVIALLIFVATSMPHRGAPQKVKRRGATATEDLALESGTASYDKSLFPITDSGRPITK